jgi:hypothetical protein
VESNVIKAVEVVLLIILRLGESYLSYMNHPWGERWWESLIQVGGLLASRMIRWNRISKEEQVNQGWIVMC